MLAIKHQEVVSFHSFPRNCKFFLMMCRVLGKTAAIRKNTRMLSEFQNHLSSSVSGSRLAIAKDYFDMLIRLISTPLMEGNVLVL